MNEHIEAMRTAITAYYKQAKELHRRNEEDAAKYIPEVVKDLKTENDRQLRSGRDDALVAIDNAQRAALAELEERCKLRGDQLTPDAQLLSCGIELTTDELGQLLQRYDDNYTMTRLIRGYIDQHGQSLDTWPLKSTPEDRAANLARITASAVSLVESIYKPDATDPVRLALMDQIVTEWGKATEY